MQLILNSISTAAVNLLVFSAIPFLWWFFRHRKETSFFRWLGFIKPKLNGKWWTLVVFAIIYYFFYTFDFTRWIPQETMDYLENSGSVSVNAFAGIALRPYCRLLLKISLPTAWRRKFSTAVSYANCFAISWGP